MSQFSMRGVSLLFFIYEKKNLISKNVSDYLIFSDFIRKTVYDKIRI